jgi:hypothetical protein
LVLKMKPLSNIIMNIVDDHYRVVVELGLQEFFSRNADNYIFNSSPELDLFYQHPAIDKYGHSGASFAIMCRHMQRLCKNVSQ